MKKLILLTVLLFISVAIVAQERWERKDAIYLSHQPWDHGIGIRGDYHFWVTGVYGSVSYGTLGLYKQANLKDHFKGTLGLLLPGWDSNGNQFDFSAGLNYHKVTKSGPTPIGFATDGAILKHWSFELGLSVKLKRLAVGVRTDMLRWEPCIDIGIPIPLEKKIR